ncbi:type II toxin-antitoxin system HicB family antitoxin [Mesorhizobium sp. WSM4310]|uniref:type II toxin-antitoxin system HicB family antitoxin n=1 Tax=Mesorhizobium sp. WSM4310 TaxID=2589883 RepID=UPI00115F2E98|nr:type II toxin-antitoxin system HicB family antitoxin [Mesorhizobium sp. WSM4310]TRC78545.1 type II toxin-antitoxin system HicB family antitoxin [Mesorhizobium sp. WSM4310]
MRTVTHKGYQCSVEFDDGALFVKVLHIDDVLVAQCDSASEAQATAVELIDAYLEDCRELGRAPSKPFKGSFNVRVEPHVHRGAALAAAEAAVSLNSWVATAIHEKLECGKFQERVDSVFAAKREIALIQVQQMFRATDWIKHESNWRHSETAVLRVPLTGHRLDKSPWTKTNA